MRKVKFVDGGDKAYDFIVGTMVSKAYPKRLIDFEDSALQSDNIWHFTHKISVFMDMTETYYIIIVQDKDKIYFALADEFDYSTYQLPTGEWTMTTPWYKQEGILCNKKIALSGNANPPNLDPETEQRPDYTGSWGYQMPSSDYKTMRSIYVENKDKLVTQIGASSVNRASYDLKGIVFTLDTSGRGDLWINYTDNNIMFSLIARHKHNKPTSSVFILTMQNVSSTAPLYMLIGSNGDYSTFVYDVDDPSTAPTDYPEGIIHVHDPKNIYMAVKMQLDSVEGKPVWYTNFGATRHQLRCSLEPGYWNYINTINKKSTGDDIKRATLWKNTDIKQQPDLPLYSPLTSSQDLDFETANTMNGLALVYPLIFYAIREPHYKKEFSCVGKSDVLGYVSMSNMASGRYLQSTFPERRHEYQCFNVGERRMSAWVEYWPQGAQEESYKIKGFGGYIGLAFRSEFYE